MIKSIIVFVLSFFLATCSGCGYKYGSLLPEGIDSIHVAPFENGIDPAREVSDRRSDFTYVPNLETDLTKQVINDFIVDGNLIIKSEKQADLLLKGILTDFRQLPLSYDDDDNVVEQRVEIFVTLELYENSTGKLLWKESSFMGHDSYNVSDSDGDVEQGAVEAGVKDISRRIVERVIEAW